MLFLLPPPSPHAATLKYIILIPPPCHSPFGDPSSCYLALLSATSNLTPSRKKTQRRSSRPTLLNGGRERWKLFFGPQNFFSLFPFTLLFEWQISDPKARRKKTEVAEAPLLFPRNAVPATPIFIERPWGEGGRGSMMRPSPGQHRQLRKAQRGSGANFAEARKLVRRPAEKPFLPVRPFIFCLSGEAPNKADST